MSAFAVSVIIAPVVAPVVCGLVVSMSRIIQAHAGLILTFFDSFNTTPGPSLSGLFLAWQSSSLFSFTYLYQRRSGFQRGMSESPLLFLKPLMVNKTAE